MQEIVIALLLIVNGEIKEHRIQDSMSDCLKGKRVASREVRPERVQFHCQKLKAKTEIYMGKKKILKIIDTMEKG